MQNLRVLWLSNNDCVLFNSLDKRISGRCPTYVGNVVERIYNGEEINTALDSENVDDKSLRFRTKKIINYIDGELIVEPYHIGITEQIFAETLVLCPTSKCNLRCIYCSGMAGCKSNQNMSWSLAKKAIDFFFDNNISSNTYLLQFHGAGEPFVNFKIVKRSVDYSREIVTKRGKTLLTRISTNGVYNTEKAQWLADNFDHVNLSLDGPKEIHDIHRFMSGGKSSYDHVIQTLDILEQKNALSRINTVITSLSVNRMAEILKHFRSISKVNEVRLLPVSFCGRCEVSGVNKLETALFEEKLQEVLPLAESLGFRLVSYLEQLDYYTDYYCGACGFNMVVGHNGNISTCVEVLDKQDSGAAEMIVGHYDSHRDVIRIDWDKVSYLRTRTYKSLNTCTKCVFRTNCSGYCLVRAARENGTVMSVNSESCRTVKKVLSNYILSIADGEISPPTNR